MGAIGEIDICDDALYPLATGNFEQPVHMRRYIDGMASVPGRNAVQLAPALAGGTVGRRISGFRPDEPAAATADADQCWNQPPPGARRGLSSEETRVHQVIKRVEACVQAVHISLDKVGIGEPLCLCVSTRVADALRVTVDTCEKYMRIPVGQRADPIAAATGYVECMGTAGQIYLRRQDIVTTGGDELVQLRVQKVADDVSCPFLECVGPGCRWIHTNSLPNYTMPL